MFLHQIRDGATDDSYGVQVADLAGLPESVVKKARQRLETLEQTRYDPSQKLVADEHQNNPPDNDDAKTDPVKARLISTQLDSLSPKEALDLLYELKGELKDK